MSKAYGFIKECGCFFVATMNGEFPAVRPFGAIMEVGESLYLATHDGNEVHKQLRADPHIQIIAKKPESREWLRISAIAEECADLSLKERFFEECPVLKKHYGEASSPRFLLFRAELQTVDFHE